MKKLLIFTSLCLAFSVAQAKTLYVDISAGNDSTSYEANNSSNPWASLGRATWGSTSHTNTNANQAARAGDVVIVRAGSYNVTAQTGQRYNPVYNPVNNGSSGNPITFRADGNVVLSSSPDTAGGPLIGTLGRSHIVWDGFILDERNINTNSDTGPVVIWESDNITVQNLTVRGITSHWNDNHNAIRIERSRDSLVRNNTLYGTRNAGNNRNGSAITIYYSNNITIEHNDIFDSVGGIYIKAGNGGPITIRYNYFHDLDGEGIAMVQLGTSSEQYGGQIYQNIFRDSSAGITFMSIDSYGPANIDVVNNTFYNIGNGGIFFKPTASGYRDLVFANNIIANSNRGIQAEDISDLSSMTYRNNMYSGNSTHARVNYTNHSYSSWQNTFNKDTVGSLIADPAFASTTANTLNLSGSSQANNAGVDILNLQGQGTNASINLGAYVTGNEVIGVTTGSLPAIPVGGTSSAPPSPAVLY
ncbi:MAG: right-handed parallel beta-helix repeat-containing protein [Candidatus Thiodiazotropha sp.]